MEWPDILTELHRQLDPIATDVRKINNWTREHERMHVESLNAARQARATSIRARYTAILAALAALAALVQALVTIWGA